MQKLISWCKKEWLLLASCFFVVFIPLYPKLPLFDIVQTWVYVRIEDLLVAVTFAIFFLMLWRKKLFPRTALTIPIFVYWAIGFVSLVYSILFIGPKLLNYFPHLALLHFARRIEYMGLFFIGYYALVKKPSHITAVIWTLTCTTIAIIIYGIGQKFYGFPAFLTMNEEFAKGVPLRLPPTARIASTFGGHYDLGAYLVLVIPIFGSLVFGMEKFWQRFVMFCVAVLSLLLLLFTASRVSFLVYVVSISMMLIWRKKSAWVIPVVIASFVMLNFVSGASERFYKTFRFSDVIVDLSTGQPIGTLDQLEGTTAKMEKQESPATETLPKGSGFIGVTAPPAAKPAKAIKTIEYITSSALATGSGEIATISGSFLIQKAFVYDISLTTRFQAEWPMAMEAFSRNYLLGSGFSTLSVATDGDYMRMLGETGIFGTIAFLGIFFMAFTIFLRMRNTLLGVSGSFVIGVFAGIFGLFLNASLIDVFEASKVAFTLWLLFGFAMAEIALQKTPRLSYFTVLKDAVTSQLSVIVYLCIAVAFVYKDALSLYFMGDDFTWLRWAASTPSSQLYTYFTNAIGFFYRPIPKLLYFLLYAVFWLKPLAYHVISLVLFVWISSALYLYMCARAIRRWIALLLTVLFIVLSVHHEIVYWISTYSHMLSAAFLISAFLAFDVAWKKGATRIQLWWVVGMIFTFLSALSYEGGGIAPLVIVWIGYMLYGVRSWKLLGVMVISPLYWWCRTSAGSAGASGNYGVRPTTLLVNVVANAFGYILATFFGPKVVEFFEAARSMLRSYLLWISIGVLASAVIGWIKIRLVKLQASTLHTPLLWVGAACISMIPYLGLGGITERYALIPSMFLIIAMAQTLEELLQSTKSRIAAYALVVTILILLVWNYKELSRVSGDWKKASGVSETAVLALKANFFPLQNTQAFVFVNTPIRYGRAWIFPTGLHDALWHMFKFNNFAYSVYSATSVPEALKVKSPQGTPYILEFDRYVLKRVVREVKTIEVEETP